MLEKRENPPCSKCFGAGKQHNGGWSNRCLDCGGSGKEIDRVRRAMLGEPTTDFGVLTIDHKLTWSRDLWKAARDQDYFKKFV